MKKSIYLLAMICSFLVAACSPETEDIFGESSSVRIDKALQQELDVLTGASNGWLMEYFPQSQQAYGGYNVLVSFTKEGEVTVAADIAEPTATATSLYKLRDLAGPTLSFDTYNDIFHFFSDPASGVGQTGLGMEGDYDFTIMSATPEQVILKGRKSGNRVVMTPVPEGTAWTDYLTSVKAIEEGIPYTNFTTTADGIEYAIQKGSYRTFTVNYTENGEDISEEFAYIQRPNSIWFYSPFTLGSKQYDELFYEKETGYYVSEDGSLILKGEATPPAQLFALKGPWFVTYEGMSSEIQKKASLGCEAIKGVAGAYPDVFAIGSYIYSDNALNVIAGEAYGILVLDTQIVSDEEVCLVLTGNGDQGGVGFYNAGGAYLFQTVATMGEGITWKVVPDNLENPTTMTMTEVGNESNVITVTNKETLFGFPGR